MCSKLSHLVQSLIAPTLKKVNFKWTVSEQKACDEIKWIVSRDTLFIYPNFNKSFDIHTDASEFQLGAVIIQDSKPISFNSRKLTWL